MVEQITSKLKKAAGIAEVPVSAVISAAGIMFMIIGVRSFFHKEVDQLKKIKKVGKGIYALDYDLNYDLDGILDNGIRDMEELRGYVSKTLFHGIPLEEGGDKVESLHRGCSVFAARDLKGRHFMGRNFDYDKTDLLILYTKPKNDYESISLVDLGGLGVSGAEGFKSDNPISRILMMVSPYACIEGVNEMGLAAAILELETEETHQDRGKKPLLILCAVRAVLDKCATVDEAVALLNEYDIQSFYGYPYHLMLMDKSGKSVVMEWPENKTSVVETKCVTNFQLSDGPNKGEGIGQDRYEIMQEFLQKKRGIFRKKEGMKLLEKVSIPWNGEWDTEWSAIYALEDFSVDICVRMDYTKRYHFESNRNKMKCGKRRGMFFLRKKGHRYEG